MRAIIALLTTLGLCAMSLGGHYEPRQTTGLTGTSSNGGWSVTRGSGTISAGAGGGGGAGTLSGTASTKFVWVRRTIDGVPDPSDEPPDNAIVIEESDLQATATAYGGAPTASASNGLGTVTIPLTIPIFVNGMQIGTHTSSTCFGKRAKIVPGDEEITVENTIAGGAASSAGPHSISYAYNVDVYIVDLEIQRSVEDLGTFCEIGRSHGGAISTSAPGVTFSSHVWSVSGEVFKDFVVSTDRTNASVLNLSFADLHQPTPSWKWREPTDYSTVSCTVNAAFEGASIGSLTENRECTVEGPTEIRADFNTSGRSVTYYEFANILGFSYGVRGLHSGGNPNFVFRGCPVGMRFTFGASGPRHFNGSYLFCGQTIDAEWTMTLATETVPPILSNYVQSTSGNSQLDTDYPYSRANEPNFGWTECASYEEAPIPTTIFDTPKFMHPLATGVSVISNFNLYLFYVPDDIWGSEVPIQAHLWDWTGSSYEVSSVASPNSTSQVTFPEFPTWSAIFHPISPEVPWWFEAMFPVPPSCY